MEITTEQIKALRDKTGISVMQCKKALEEANGDVEKALVILRRKGADIAAKKGDRTLGAGIVSSYIHANGTVGALVELSCETDFVSNNEEFKTLARDLAMQVAATRPEFIRTEDISESAKANALEVLTKEVEGKPEDMKAKILEGKMASYFSDKVLLAQPFIKNGDLTVEQLISNAVQKFGEKIEIGRFSRFAVGEK